MPKATEETVVIGGGDVDAEHLARHNTPLHLHAMAFTRNNAQEIGAAVKALYAITEGDPEAGCPICLGLDALAVITIDLLMMGANEESRASLTEAIKSLADQMRSIAERQHTEGSA